jgi:outer membrane protein TolC
MNQTNPLTCPERRFKALPCHRGATLLFLLLSLFLGTLAPAQTTLDTFFSHDDLMALERLIHLAQANNPTVIEATAAFEVGQAQRELGGRLTDALTVNVGAGLSGDLYGQVSPTYSITASVDVMKLVHAEDRTHALTARLAAAKAETRSAVATAFVGYVVARNAAEAAALAADSSSAAFKVIQARVDVGEATLTDQLHAQSAVSNAALALLQANGNVIVALERLAATTGTSPEVTLAIVQHQEITSR